MRFIIYGAGAIGSVVGAFLHRTGADVVLVARSGHANRIRRLGLVVRTPSETYRFRLVAVSSVSDASPFGSEDVVLLTVKSQHTNVALDEMRRAGIDLETPLFCLQNAIANEHFAAHEFQFSNVYGAIVAMPALYVIDGEVAAADVEVPGFLEVGRFPRGVDETAEKIVRELRRAGFRVRTNADIMRSKYAKLLSNLGNALPAIVGLDVKDTEREALVDDLRQEAVRIWDQTGTAYEPFDEFYGRVLAETMEKSKLPPGTEYGGSTWQSMVRQTGSVEADFLNGEIVRAARKAGLSAPLNEVLCRIANEMAAQRLAPGTYTIAELRRWASKQI